MYFFHFVGLSLIALDNYDLIKNKKSCIKRNHLVTNDGLYDQKAFRKVKYCYYLLIIIILKNKNIYFKKYFKY